MAIPKRQHWVPQFYLRHFSVPGSDDERVWVCPRRKGDPFLTSVKNIAVQTHLYTPKNRDGKRDPRFDQKLSKFEDTMSRLWPRLAAGFVDLGSSPLRKGLGLFLAVQFLRHPERRASVADSRKRLLDVLRTVFDQPRAPSDGPVRVQMGASTVEFDDEDFEMLCRCDEDTDSSDWIALIDGDAITCARMLMRRRWSIVFIDEPLFVTSDYPLFVAQPELERHQIGATEAVILFPISPTRMLCIDTIDAPANEYHRVPNEEADIYNALTWVNAESFMISSRHTDEVLLGIARVRAEAEDSIGEEE